MSLLLVLDPPIGEDCPFETIFEKNLYIGESFDTTIGFPPMLPEYLINYTLWLDGGIVSTEFVIADVLDDCWDDLGRTSSRKIVLVGVKDRLATLQQDVHRLVERTVANLGGSTITKRALKTRRYGGLYLRRITYPIRTVK
jgi:hypothetical protein